MGLVPKYFDSLFLGILRRKTFHFEKTAGQSEILETTKGSSDLFSRKAPAGYRYLEVHEVLEVP